MGAFDNDNLVGMAGFIKEEKTKLKHKGTIWGMFVNPNQQGKGVGAKLLYETLNKAFEFNDLKQINLAVVSTNKKAVQLYEKAGFIVYGIEKDALLNNGKFTDDLLMVKVRD